MGLGRLVLERFILTSYAASQVDRFLPTSLALVLILLTTAVGASLATLWASQALAMLAFLGGYVAPLLFASALFDHWLFLGYLLILTLGGQILAYAKNWRPLYSSGAVWTWLSTCRLVSARLSKRMVSRDVCFHPGFVRRVLLDAFLASGCEEGIKLESGFPFGCGQWIVLLLVFRVPFELPEVVGFFGELELRGRQPGACVVVLEAANAWASVELAHRTGYRFSSRLLGTTPEQLLGDCFLVS